MNVLSCGLILTAVARDTLDTSQMEGLVPMRRLGDPAEVGDAAVFLVSPRSSYISGQNIVIDGGFIADIGTPPRGGPSWRPPASPPPRC